MAELIFKFDTPAELESWLQVFKNYGLVDKLKIKSTGQKKRKKADTESTTQPVREWKSMGIGDLNGALDLDKIPNIRDFAYED